MLNAKLIIVGGKSKTKEVRLKLPTTIGRGKEADLTIPHALVSRSHSLLFERDGQLCVKDLGSLNGTFVDNKRIETEQIISPNQLLTLGDITFRAVYDMGQSAVQTLPDIAASSLQTVMVDPINNPSSSDSEQTVDAKANVSPTVDVAETPKTRSVISEIDSFDPDEIGSLDKSEKFESQAPTPEQSISNNPTIMNPAGPTLRNSPKPNKSQAQKSPTPAVTNEGPTDPALANLTEEPPVAQLSSVDIQLDLPEDSSSPVSFVGNIQTDDSNSTSVIDDFQIDLGTDVQTEASIDESQLGSFLKNLPK